MKSYTDLEQSKKLAEILPLESADMYWYRDAVTKEANPRIMNYTQVPELQSVYYSPCWSLAALLSILKYPSLTQDIENKWFITDWTGAYPKSEHGFDNPVDACVAMIIKLHEQNLL